MKILFISPQIISKSMGISRVLIELQNALKSKNLIVDLLGPKELGLSGTNYNSYADIIHFQQTLHNYLLKNAKNYDVVDYDHEYLPFERKIFHSTTLFVARTVLLIQHLEHIKIPQPFTLRSYLGRITKGYQRQKLKSFRINSAKKTVFNADLINVPNYEDQKLLIDQGIPESKISVIPFGFSPERILDFSSTNQQLPQTPPTIAFLGTFDYRKGALSIPKVFKNVHSFLPNSRLKLLGCKGMKSSPKEILKFFHKKLHPNIEIIMHFKRDEIGKLLQDCHLGIFPTYMEGFCFGIAEMMMAHIPVITYNSPGSSILVKKSLIVDQNDINSMSTIIKKLLTNPEILLQERKDARIKAESFTWKKIADLTINAYNHARNPQY